VRFVRPLVATLLLSLVPLTATLPAERQPGSGEAEAAARRFGRALIRGDASELRPLMPKRGKLRLLLVCLGPEEGSYSGSQVEALLKGFLRSGAVHRFEVERTEGEAGHLALIDGKASVTDRQGRAHEIELHLTFQPEDGRWVLREIRETGP